MIKLAHIVNIYGCAVGDDGHRVQQITLETMRRAKANCGHDMEVELLSAQFSSDRYMVPKEFRATPDLHRSVQDFVNCKDKRRLPFIHDILQNGVSDSDAEYLVYSNMDISLYPGFYSFIAKAIKSGVDALAINRAQVSRFKRGKDLLHDCSVDDWINQRWRTPHHGIDCVMFKKSTFSKWTPCTICIGYPPVGQYLLENAEYHSEKFVWYKDAQFTFHIGVDNEQTSPWKNVQGNEIWRNNDEEFARVRLYEAPAWDRHGFTRPRWIARRASWLARSLVGLD